MFVLVLTNPSEEKIQAQALHQLLSEKGTPLFRTALTLSGNRIIKKLGATKNYGFCSITRLEDKESKVIIIGLAGQVISVSKQGMLLREAKNSWDFRIISRILPSPDVKYKTINGENNNYVEYAYNSGALRVFVSPYNNDVFAFMIDTSKLDYKNYLIKSDSYDSHRINNYLIVCHKKKVSEDTFYLLKKQELDLSMLDQLIGSPSCRSHIHGLGNEIFSYVPLGLEFQTTNNDNTVILTPSFLDSGLLGEESGVLLAKNQKLTYGDYSKNISKSITEFALFLINKQISIDNAIKQGKKSLDGNYTIGLLEEGGYWDNWIIVKPRGKAEYRVNADYFISGYQWLDDNTILYADAMGKFSTINVKNGENSEVYETGEYIDGFNIHGNRVQYSVNGGLKEFTIPEFRP